MTSIFHDVERALPPVVQKYLFATVDNIIRHDDGSYDIYGETFQVCIYVDTRNFHTVHVSCPGYRGGKPTPVYERLGNGCGLYSDNLSDWVQGVGSIMQYYVEDYQARVGIKKQMDDLINRADRIKLNMDINAHNYQLEDLEGIERCIAVIMGEMDTVGRLI